jgi:hypothetical protein
MQSNLQSPQASWTWSRDRGSSQHLVSPYNVVKQDTEKGKDILHNDFRHNGHLEHMSRYFGKTISKTSYATTLRHDARPSLSSSAVGKRGLDINE